MSISMDEIRPLFEELTNECVNLKSLEESGADIQSTAVSSISNILNKIFPQKQCATVLYTKNTDNVFFGIMVTPTISNIDLMNILIDTEEMDLDRYTVEIDSKAVAMFDPEELAAYILHDIDTVTNSSAITRVRAYIDIIMTQHDESIDIRNSVNYSNILIYGIKDALYKLTALIHQLDTINAESGVYLTDVANKIRFDVVGLGADVSKPEMSVLQWCLILYNNVDTEYKMAIETLTTAKGVTGSQLQKGEIDKVIKSLKRAANEVVSESNVTIASLEEAKGLSLFKSLKQNGLRSIEDDLYEYKVRIKNCETQEDAIYILRCINSRIAILEDYLANTPNLSDTEIKRWSNLIEQYRELRVQIGQLKFQVPNDSWNALMSIDYSKL